jgi:hypothetical protein
VAAIRAADIVKISLEGSIIAVAAYPPMIGAIVAALSVTPRSILKIRPTVPDFAASPNAAEEAVPRIAASIVTSTIPAPRRSQNVANEYETKPRSVTSPPRRMKGFRPILSMATPTGRRRNVMPRPPTVWACPTKDMLTPRATISGATDGELNPTAKPNSASAAMSRAIVPSESDLLWSLVEPVTASAPPQV